MRTRFLITLIAAIFAVTAFASAPAAQDGFAQSDKKKKKKKGDKKDGGKGEESEEEYRGGVVV